MPHKNESRADSVSSRAGKPPVSLIELFSPKGRRLSRSGSRRSAGRDVWAADSLHRINNLAQLAASLGHVAKRLPAKAGRAGVIAALIAKGEALARDYAELGTCDGDETPVACREPLRRIVCGLVDLFGEPKRIGLCFNGAELALPGDQRRALILIASELVVNALKYAFPAGRPGMIEVSLWSDGGEIQLVVQDDGVGMSGSERVGTGSSLIHQLGAILGASVGRASSEYGHRVWVRFPAVVGDAESADEAQPVELPIFATADEAARMHAADSVA